MQGLNSSISSLSLNQTNGLQGSTASSKKSRRPNRAFHQLGETSTVQESPKLSFGAAKPFGTSDGVQNGSAGIDVASSTVSSVVSHFVPTERLEDQQSFMNKCFVTSQDSIPPLSVSQFYSFDQGSSDPRKMRLTMYNIPHTEYLRSATKLPLGALLQPFATSIPSDDIPVIDCSTDSGPLRCRRCRAYVNAGFSFTFDSKAVCNFCQVSTRLEEHQQAPLNPDGTRSDFAERPELSNGTIEFLLPEQYNAIKDMPNLPLHYVFLIDISTLANENKSSLAMVEAVRTSIEYIAKNQPQCKVAIIAYDNKIRFFNLRPENFQAQEYIVSDLHETFLPIYNGLFVRPEESMHVIQDTLSKLTTFIEDEKFFHKFEACYGSALEAAKLALDTVTGRQGGKIVASLCSKPIVGNGNLRLRADDALKKSLKCENEFYAKLSRDLLSSYISVDLYCTTSAYVDMISVGQPSLVTSGKVKYYPHFNIDRDEFTLVNDVLNGISTIVGYGALVKVRCSSELSIYNYYSESCNNSNHEPTIPVLSKDSNLTVLFKYDGQLPVSKDVYFQAAVLYTDIEGQRRVRCLNTSGATSDNIHEIFKFVCQDASLSIMVHDVISTLGDCNFVNIRKLIDGKICDVLTQYRALVSTSPSTQLILPDSLKTLPAFLLAFEKSELMKNNNKTSHGNTRVHDLMLYHTMTPAQMSLKLYPQIIPLHEHLSETDLTFFDENSKLLQITPSESLSVRASRASLVDGGCYLICNGSTVYLWLNENTNRFLLRDLLGLDAEQNDYKSVLLFANTLPTLDTDINVKARNLLQNWCNILNCCYLPVLPLRPNVDMYYSGVMEQILCEDKSIEMIESYTNYLVHLHRAIQEKIGRGDYIKPSAARDHEHFSQKFIHF
ncbi:LAMI_0B03730g1_1 [Lachancea mirantina]|uniref:LAMI_0B03730g1_1 n=1 Tax=Lachancea mirantina TaxID=1230905 RepID=A0A1G4IVG0_9SACH|nr:LAMI_0B03730g1_1 [Lachancea mirantina]